MADIQERRGKTRIDCYTRSRADDNIEHGLVVDISATGAGLTMPKDTPLFKGLDPKQSADSYGRLRLNIFHPDYSLEHGLNIDANIAWLDHDYSRDRVKLGVHFSGMDEGKSSYIGKFIDWIQEKENYFLHCEVEKC